MHDKKMKIQILVNLKKKYFKILKAYWMQK